jgi:ribosomal protein S18 acetylase RimI-like enzyme
MSPPLTYQREAFAAVWDEAKPLAARDWDEMIPYRTAAKQSVNVEQYAEFERRGMLRLYIVRRGTCMIGYMCFLVTPGTLHASTTMRASCTDWYIIPEERSGFAGVRLKEFAEQSLRNEGVVLMVVDVMAESDSAIRLLEGTGYERGGISYFKVLRERADA